MFDPFLKPSDASYVVRLDNKASSILEMKQWLQSNGRSRWCCSGWLGGFIFSSVYFWFCDELDFDIFRGRFGGTVIADI